MIVLQLVEDACHLRSALTQEAIKVFILLWVMEAVREGLDVGDHGAQKLEVWRICLRANPFDQVLKAPKDRPHRTVLVLDNRYG